MNRSGFLPNAENIFSSLSGLTESVCGAYTHFPSADAEELNDTKTRLSAFKETAHALEALLKRRIIKHSAASCAAIRLPCARLDRSRIGLLLYGVPPCDKATLPGLRPVMTLSGSVTGIRRVKKGETVGYGCVFKCKRDSVIATVDVGYACGLKRILRGRFMPMLLGERLPIAAICMDRTMLDVTELFEGGKTVRTGETVTFFGNEPSVTEMADAAETISYEILTSVKANDEVF